MLESTTRPDWVGKRPHLESHDGIEVYVATATAGPYSTPEECDRAIGPEIDRVVADFAEKRFEPTPEQLVKLDRDEIQQHLIKGRYRETVDSPSVGEMQQEHVLLEFDSQVRAAIEQAWRSMIVTQRLKYTAAGSGALFLALGGVYLILKLKPGAEPAGHNPTVSSGPQPAAKRTGTFLVVCALVAAVCSVIGLLCLG